MKSPTVLYEPPKSAPHRLPNRPIGTSWRRPPCLRELSATAAFSGSHPTSWPR